MTGCFHQAYPEACTNTVRPPLFCVSVSALHWRASPQAAWAYGAYAARYRAGWLCSTDHKPSSLWSIRTGQGHGRAVLAFPLAARARAEGRGRGRRWVAPPLAALALSCRRTRLPPPSCAALAPSDWRRHWLRSCIHQRLAVSVEEPFAVTGRPGAPSQGCLLAGGQYHQGTESPQCRSGRSGAAPVDR